MLKKGVILLIFAICTVGATIQKLTYYWVVHESEFPAGSQANLNTCNGRNLASTSKAFADRIALEGSGYLRDGKTVLNLGSCISDSNPCKPSNGNYNCFIVVDAPVGSNDNPLKPYVSIASNDIPYGTTGIVEEFVGMLTPQGETHNGCVSVDDSCSTCNNKNWIDFYAFKESNYEWFNEHYGFASVNFVKQSCTPKNYRA